MLPDAEQTIVGHDPDLDGVELPLGEDAADLFFSPLRRDEQLALALRGAGRFRYEEIAALLDVPIGIAFLRISQARGSMLRQAAGGAEGEP